MTEERLERIEGKVDKMHIKIVAMAIMEERMITVFKKLNDWNICLRSHVSLYKQSKMLEFDTTHNSFRDDLLTEPMNIQNQVKVNNGTVSIPSGPGLGVTPDRKFMEKYNICN